MKFILFLICGLIGNFAFAAATQECGYLDSIGNLIGGTKTVGNVRVAYVSTEEPAIAPDHILVFVYDQQMGKYCTAISNDVEGNGFAFVDMKTLKSISYDPKKGRLFQIDVKVPNLDSGEAKTQTLRFRAHGQTGKVSLE